jgi:hypothetical protein
MLGRQRLRRRPVTGVAGAAGRLLMTLVAHTGSPRNPPALSISSVSVLAPRLCGHSQHGSDKKGTRPTQGLRQASWMPRDGEQQSGAGAAGRRRGVGWPLESPPPVLSLPCGEHRDATEICAMYSAREHGSQGSLTRAAAAAPEELVSAVRLSQLATRSSRPR